MSGNERIHHGLPVAGLLVARQAREQPRWMIAASKGVACDAGDDVDRLMEGQDIQVRMDDGLWYTGIVHETRDGQQLVTLAIEALAGRRVRLPASMYE